MLGEGSQAMCITDESEQLLNSYEASDCSVIPSSYRSIILQQDFEFLKSEIF
jgi:hypothetical protein